MGRGVVVGRAEGGVEGVGCEVGACVEGLGGSVNEGSRV